VCSRLEQDRGGRVPKDGENPKVVQERLGHSTVSLTLDTYSSVLPGIHSGAAERLAARFAKPGRSQDGKLRPDNLGAGTIRWQEPMCLPP
jgi:hypothetical protein